MKITILFLLVVMGTGWSLCTAGQSCERITHQMCQGLGYNYTQFPNRFNHRSQNQAMLEMNQFYPLIKVGCSSSLKKFLCSMYMPKCSKTPVPPCRSLCKQAKSGCGPIMKKFGISWPKKTKCSRFPDYENESCISSTENKSGRIKATQGSRCEKITIPLCQGMSYNYTMYPNLLNHKTQDEAGLEVNQFYPLVKIRCSSALKTLLCTLYAPRCSDTLIPPCRSLCELCKSGCQKLMHRFGFTWPASLNCSLFPVERGDAKCIAPKYGSDLTTTTKPKTDINAFSFGPKNLTTTTKPKTDINAFSFGPKKFRALLTKVQGVFTSPNYPKLYPQDSEIDWTIELPDSYKLIKITMEKMRLEEDRNCLYDYIIIKDKMLNQVGPRHCGTYRYPYEVLVRGNKAIVNFVSDGSTSKVGFLIRYRGLQSDS